MKVAVLCESCKQELQIKEVIHAHALEEIQVLVLPCSDPGCYDCSKCEVEQRLQKLKVVLNEDS